MGRKSKSVRTGLAAALFTRVQLKLLALLLGHPNREFHASEIIRLARSGSGAVQRELLRLAGAGILSVATSGNRKLYRANRDSPIFHELQQIILKTEGLVEPIRRALSRFQDRIDVGFVYGSVAKRKDTSKSDIDLMLIGSELGYSEVFSELQKAERILLRSISPNVMTKEEWTRKRKDKNSFAMRVAEQPKLFVFGTEDEFQGIR